MGPCLIFLPLVTGVNVFPGAVSNLSSVTGLPGVTGLSGVTDLPVVTDLQMTHHSDICVLLRWSPPHPGPAHKQLGYRVFVNGTAEGMVRVRNGMSAPQSA